MGDQPQIPASEQAKELYGRFLLKTAIKCFVWFGIAWVVVYFFPTQTWVWYVAAAFIFIAIAFALGVKLLGLIARRTEQKAAALDTEDTDG